MKEFIEEFKQKYSADDVIHYINLVEDLRILAIGETIIDEYMYGHTLGMSRKAPMISFRNKKLEKYQGGVIAIHNHLKDFCDIEHWTDDNVAIVRKYIEDDKRIFQTYSIEKTGIESICTDKFFENFKDYDLVLIADFGHGMMKKDMINEIEAHSYYIALNCQTNTYNQGLSTINKYETADYICIDEYELRLALCNQFDNLEDMIMDNIQDGVTLTVTLGKEGSLIYKDGEFVYTPPFAEDLVDSTGAGDAFLAVTSPLVCIGTPLDMVGFIGNCAGALVCSWFGNKKSVTKKELCEYIRRLMR